MFCAISGTTPQHPVVSVKSGLVYEKELILKYIRDNDGKDPVTGEELKEEDLVPIKTASALPAAPPRPPTLSSIPSLLHTLQNEWDATMLEVLEMRKTGSQLRQELSHALYKEDAAMRVLARVVRERDEAREALADVQRSLSINPSALRTEAASADVEMSDASAGQGVPQNIAQRIKDTAEPLSAARRKRKAPADHATPADLKTFAEVDKVTSLHSTKPPGVTTVDVAGASGELLLTGGNDKTVQVYDRTSGKNLATLKGHTKKITSAYFAGSPTSALEGSNSENLPPFVVSSSADKTVRVWTPAPSGKSAYSSAATLSGHNGEVTSLSIHPSGTLVASASLDSTWAIHDLTADGGPTTVVSRSLSADAQTPSPAEVGNTSIAFHPDGNLLAIGGSDGNIRIVDAISLATAATFEHSAGSIQSLTFSENGYTLASYSSGSEEVKIWDLRKLSNSANIKLESGETVNQLLFDPSAQALAGVGTKLRLWANKTWAELLTWDGNGDVLTGVAFAEKGKQIVVGGIDRTVRVLSKPAA